MSFLYPSFLWALFALAIPIVVHLFNFRRPTKAAFTNVAFLREVKQSTNKSRKLKHLLVLLTRLLALAFLVFLFAQPFIPADKKSGGIASQIILIADNSYSMQSGLNGSDGSLFTYSVNSLQELVQAFPRGTSTTVIDNSFSGNSNFNSEEEVKQKLSAMDFAGNLRSTTAILSRVSSAIDNPSNASSFYFSDFQKSTFNLNALGQVDSLVRYNLVHLPAKENKNLFVDSVEIPDVFIRSGENNNLAVSVRNIGKEEVSTNVKFFMGNQQVSTLDVEIQPGSIEKVNFSFRLPDNTEQLCRIVLEDFPVTFDNEYCFTIQASPKIQITNVANDPVNPVGNVYANEPVFSISTTSEAAINYEEFSKSNLIVLNEMQELNAALADNVLRQVEGGASVLLIPATNPSKDSYSAFFNRAGITSVVFSSSGSKLEVAPPDINNPFFQKIFEDIPRGVETPSATPVLGWSRAQNDLLRFKNGAPFLSQFRKGKGNVFVLAAPLKSDHSSFAANALFVPVFYKLAMLSQQASSYSAYSFSQNILEVILRDKPANEQIYTLVKDSVEWIPDQRIVGNRLIVTIPGELSEAGYYQLIGPNGVERTLAFNYDERESELEQYTADELRKLTEAYPNVQVHEAGTGGSFAKKYREETEGKPLWIYCLIICLIALAAETAIIRFVK